MFASQVKEMVDVNDSLPDLERLDRHEFELDVEEQGRILADTDAVVQKVSCLRFVFYEILFFHPFF